MKKVLAILLAVLTVFSFTAVAASAEGEETPATGTVYKLSDKPAQITQKTDAEVVIFKDGDTIEFGTVTASTTKKPKAVEIVYYPDAASISATNIKNTNWKETVVPKYNLDTKVWELEKGQVVADLYAKSPNYYKTFYTTASFEKGEVASLPVVGLNSTAVIGRDSAKVVRGVVPIDYKLDNATFVGWALYKYSWNASDTTTATVELYALWDRGHAPEQPTEPAEEEGDDPIVNAMNKVLHAIDVVAGWIGAVPALVNIALSLVIETGLRNLLYKIFGIAA